MRPERSRDRAFSLSGPSSCTSPSGFVIWRGAHYAARRQSLTDSEGHDVLAQVLNGGGLRTDSWAASDLFIPVEMTKGNSRGV